MTAAAESSAAEVPAVEVPAAEIKVCGVTRVADALAAAALGVDYLGLNFYPPSPRALDLERAAEIAAAVRGRVRLVGVFVDRPFEEVEAIDRAVGLDLLQFHGDETPEAVAPYRRRALKAIRLTGAAPDLAPWAGVWGLLFEPRGDLYGGSGRAWAYERLAGLAPAARHRFVAGGVGPENARQALLSSGATGVDVCSGVEASPGVKDPRRIERLVAAVREAAA